MSGKDLEAEWFVGPSWHREYICNWPSYADFDLTLTDDDPEMKKHRYHTASMRPALTSRRYAIHVSKQPSYVGGLKLHNRAYRQYHDQTDTATRVFK